MNIYYKSIPSIVGTPDLGVRQVNVRVPLPIWKHRQGAAHLAEHVWHDAIFGPTSVPSFKKFIRTNAYTDEYGVTLYTTYLAKDEDIVLNTLIERIQDAEFNYEVFEREQKVVATETVERFAQEWVRAEKAQRLSCYADNTWICCPPEQVALITPDDCYCLFQNGKHAELEVIGHTKSTSTPLFNFMNEQPTQCCGVASYDYSAHHMTTDALLNESQLCYNIVRFSRIHNQPLRSRVAPIWAATGGDMESPLAAELRTKAGLVYGVSTAYDLTGEPLIWFSCAYVNLAETIERIKNLFAKEITFDSEYVERLTDSHAFSLNNRTPLQKMNSAIF